MTIKIFPSLMEGEPVESHKWEGTIDGWFDSKGIDYLNKDAQPVIVFVNGKDIPVAEWAKLFVGTDDEVEIKLLPNGFEPLTWALIAVVASVGVSLLLPKPKIAAQQQTTQGKALEATSAKANLPKLGEVVPELAGTHKRFPDYLTMPRRFFSNYVEQWVTFLMCVGPGQYFIKPEDIKIGDTPLNDLGDNATFRLYSPGENLFSDAAHENWYTSTEVGGTSSGTAGLELKSDGATLEHIRADSYTFAGADISIPAGSGSFPEAWGPNVELSIILPREYEITQQTTPEPRTVINGFYNHIMPAAKGSTVLISGGGMSGEFIVLDYSLDIYGYGWMTFRGAPKTGSDGEPIPGPKVITNQTGTKTLSISQKNVFFGIDTATPQKVTVSRLNANKTKDTSWYGFPFTTSSSASVQSVGGFVYGPFAGPFVACPEKETTNAIELDLFFPGGLAEIDSKGRLINRTVAVEFQFRAVGTTAWTSVLRYYNNATLDQWGVSEPLVVGNIQPEVRVRRVSAESNDTQIQDKVQWYGMKARLPTRFDYPGWTTLSVRIRSGGSLGASSENQINLIATRLLPELQSNGTWSEPRPTRSITAFARHIARTIGYNDSDIDMTEFRRLDAKWKARGDNFDFIFSQTTVKEALNDCFSAGMAELTVDEGLIKPVRDEARTQFEQGYSPQNMIGPLTRSFKSRSIDDADGVEVEFINSETWAKDTIRCFLPGDQGFKIFKMKVDGVTDRTKAWRIGMRQRRIMRYRNWEYSFSTELDALNSGYLSYVPLIDDIPGYGQSALLEGVDDIAGWAMLRVTEPLRWEEGRQHVVAYRKPDGSVAGPFGAVKGDDDYSIHANLPKPWPFSSLKMEPVHVYFGTSESWTFPALITEISPDGLDKVSVSATNYDARVYNDDDNFPPI